MNLIPREDDRPWCQRIDDMMRSNNKSSAPCCSNSVSCHDADYLASNSTVYSGMTNYIGGEVVNPCLPPQTRRTWVLPDGRHLCDVFDASSCRHWIEDAPDE